MESNREISPLKNNSYVRAVADQVYGDCMENVVECPTFEDLSGNGDYINLANSLIGKITQSKPGLFGKRPYQIISIERRPEIYITCGVLAEWRDFLPLPLGSGGDKELLEDPSPTKIEASDFDPWDYRGRIVDAKKLLTGDYKEIHSEIDRILNERGGFFVPPKAVWTEGFCDDCNGTGKVDCTCDNGKIICPTCKGEYYKCPSCDGLSTRSCSCCGGRGKIWGTTRKYVRKVNQWDLDFEYVEEDVSDFLTCQSCGGSGREECDEGHGLGILECPDCNGEGYITCPECNGTKKANCKTCNGHGEKLWALFMLQKFIDYFVVAPVTGFRTNAPYAMSPENGPIVPGEPLSIGKYFIEDTPFGYIEGTKER